MSSAEMAGQNVIHRQPAVMPPAVLAGIIIAAENFPPSQLDARPRPVDLAFQPDDGRSRDEL